MNLRKEEIIAIVTEINDSLVKNKEQHFLSKYAEFKKQYPMLYTMACKGIPNMSMLEYMLDMMEKIKAQETTSHEASVEVGQKLFNQYVDPNLKHATKTTTPNPSPVFTFK